MKGSIRSFNRIDWGKISQYKQFAGNHSFILINKKQIKKWLNYDLPDGYAIRIFKCNRYWQGTLLREAVIIQNIFWIYGIAPRVLKRLKFEEEGRIFHVHVVKYIKQLILKEPVENDPVLIEKLLKIAKDNFIKPYQGEHGEIEKTPHNWRGDLYTDFGGFHFIDKQKYKNKLINKIKAVTHFGKAYKGQKASYQSIPEWGVDGKRKTKYRITKMKLQEVDFENKSVLDIGCNLGMMLHYAKDRGATKLIGYDLPELIEVAREFANYKEQFDFEYKAQDLSKAPPTEKADIVLFLAMSEYLGLPKWLPKLTKEVCYYEGHAKENFQETENKLKQLFPKVVSLGQTDDRSTRPLFVCYKNE